ncbi:ferritin-like domain-containing protein [Bradyrhizobium betae]|uniref:Rubrerythrin family protein n=1 Tax=Bradyrhizobium betae TaxID=244734 RepID=A0A5P6PBD6_9BRAD|nr:ferritin family protein [Bradyrhizobium betae]MCS3727307.1 rubrerythrin [Bradyrhizobium betae]QFI74793.1 rubrerythrin family protein [Bradyrhizobium betae]
MPFLRTSLLSAEPAGVLESLEELVALAHAMEQEAANKYDSLADGMRWQGKDDLAEVFTRLAAAERDHVDSVTQWSQSRSGKMPDPAMVRWEAPETLDEEAAAEVKTSRLMTPYRALAMAARNEERAFAFWSYLAAYSADPEIKKASEAMAKEELGHVATLRKERRRAYHREHGRKPDQVPAQLDRVAARRLELCLGTHLAALERRLEGPAAVRTRELREDTMRMAEDARDFGSFPGALELRDAQMIAEALVDGYLEGAERSDEAERVEILQKLAEKAISRLAWLRSLAAE